MLVNASEGNELPFVVGVGASAGGLEALTEMFRTAPADAGIAWVVVQHLSPDHRSLMPELLSRQTSMRVCHLEPETTVEPDVVYLMPPRKEVVLENGKLLLRDRRAGHGLHLPIDRFFRSLAEQLAERAVGVVLSGTGSDGTNGARTIKGADGLVVVQEPSNAAFDGMPRSALSIGAVDAVLPASAIGQRVPELLAGIAGRGARAPGIEVNETELVRVLRLLERESGIDFTNYKRGTLRRRLARRILASSRTGLAEYVDLIEQNDAELARLRRDLLIGVTHFFRDPSMWTALRSEVLPEIAASADGTLRAWCAGCASGEEAYTLAMVLLDAVREADASVDVKVFATDVDRDAIERASTGAYPESIVADVPARYLEQHFTRFGDQYRVSRELRRAVVFAPHNLLKDPPFTRVDLVTCRNVLIYFQPEMQARALSSIHFALRDGGVLMLGPSETVGDLSSHLAPVNGLERVFRRRGAPLPLRLGLPPTRWSGRGTEDPRNRGDEQRLLDAAHRTLLRAEDAVALVVDREGRVSHVLGDASPYLSVPDGALSFDLEALASGSLGSLLTVALGRARRERDRVRYRAVRVNTSRGEVEVDVQVLPFEEPSSTQRYYLVVLAPERAVEPVERHGEDEATATRMLDLQRELQFTRENLQATIEELETSNEELQATNEELLAANEELQSTNEELQATNEELHSVNSEYQRKIQELVDLNADIDNLLQSTEIGTIFLDEQLEIRKFTPRATTFVNVLERDVGRPLSHLSLNFEGDELTERAREVLQSGSRYERAVTGRDRELLLRVLPYRDVAGDVRGVVLTFIDITDLRRVEQQLQGVLDSLPQHVAVLERDGVIAIVNRAWRRFAEENEGTGVGEPGQNYLFATETAARAGDETADAVARGLRRVLSGAESDFVFEYACDSETEMRRFILHAVPLSGGRGAVVSHTDITERVTAERAVRYSAKKYRDLFEQSHSALLIVDPESLLVRDANPRAAQLTGRQMADLLDTDVVSLATEADRPSWKRMLLRAAVGDSADDERVFSLLCAGGEPSSVRASVTPVEISGDTLVRVDLSDVTQSVLAAREKALLEERLRQSEKMEAVGNLAGGVAHELNNVLAVVVAAASSLEGVELPAEAGEEMAALISACKRGRELTTSLLSFTHRGAAVREPVDVERVLRELHSLLGSSVPGSAKLELELADALPTVEGEVGALSQAVMNLALNALDALDDGNGVVTLRARAVAVEELDRPPREAASRYVVIEVVDDGIGMDAATRERAFEPFFTTKPRGEGTGLGLATVYGVAQSLGGWVELDSEIGRGTRARLVLPAEPGEQKQAAPRVDSDDDVLRGVRLLLVDDDSLVLGSFRRALERGGATVKPVSSGEAAIEAVDAGEQFDAAVLDIVMPGIDGIETLHRLREVRPELPVLLCSGYPDIARRRRIRLDELTRFLRKPVASRELINNVAVLIGRGDEAQLESDSG